MPSQFIEEIEAGGEIDFDELPLYNLRRKLHRHCEWYARELGLTDREIAAVLVDVTEWYDPELVMAKIAVAYADEPTLADSLEAYPASGRM